MSQEQTIFAYTEASNSSYPGYLNVKEDAEKQTVVTVRTPGLNGTQTSTLVLPDDQVDELLDALISHRYLSRQPQPTAI